MKAIFTTKINPAYDDLPEYQYHFPKTYLRQVERALNDWIIYYEPRRSSADLSSHGGRQAYFATAKVLRIAEDPGEPEHYYAFVSGYLGFPRPVPFREAEKYYENGLQRGDGKTNKGAFGRAVRGVSDSEYDAIVQAGFSAVLHRSDAERESEMAEYGDEFQRPVIQTVTNRPFRDAAFSITVKDAYGQTCAFTGLKIINGGGRSEVQAAHIRPVADNGPDSVRNGLALCGTVHWMFDRGLLSVEDDLSILVAKDRVPDTVLRMTNPDGKLRAPSSPEYRPHPRFLNYHRKAIFKG